MKTTSCAHAEECPFSRVRICVQKQLMMMMMMMILLSVLKSCIDVGVGVAGTSDNDSTQSTFKLVHLFVSHRSSEVPAHVQLEICSLQAWDCFLFFKCNSYFFDLFQANAKIVNLFISSSSPGLNTLRRQAHLLNATCYFVSSPAAFEAKKKEQLLSCIFTSSDSQDSGKSSKHYYYLFNIKSIGEGVMLTDEQVIDRRWDLI
ncbi:hypothetical protein Tsp_03485 [Trichinella spiralis]|uniref:hypothetical protein n=1 Tax=Trichinella spiralis TaxID=6334 RepID=UPI0001EFB401|nr:hypothetical protein Tsp_03485 [Trichinella spiralis]